MMMLASRQHYQVKLMFQFLFILQTSPTHSWSHPHLRQTTHWISSSIDPIQSHFSPWLRRQHHINRAHQHHVIRMHSQTFVLHERRISMFLQTNLVTPKIRTRSPNYYITKCLFTTDKHWLLRMTPGELSDNVLSDIDALYRKRWQSLLAVDEMIAAIFQQLNDTNLTDNTYIILTSDNGYHMGQFAQPYDKRQPYETDIRVPLIVRGPNVPAKTIAQAPIALIDIFPTILDLAGIWFALLIW